MVRLCPVSSRRIFSSAKPVQATPSLRACPGITLKVKREGKPLQLLQTVHCSGKEFVLKFWAAPWTSLSYGKKGPFALFPGNSLLRR